MTSTIRFCWIESLPRNDRSRPGTRRRYNLTSTGGRAQCVELEGVLSDLIGCRCFSAISGSGVEFAFALHLGEKQRRHLRLANQRLSFLQRTYEGSHTLVVECTWRIDGPDGVIASCFGRAKPA